MVDDHRRVEARTNLAGTGMAVDPRRIHDIEDEAARRERIARGAPQLAFGAVLQRAPARGTTDDEPPPPRPRGEEADEDDGDDQQAAPTTAPTNAPAAPTSTAPAGAARRAPLRSAVRAPDPRARQLHAQLLQARPDRKGP
jgi:hypothetical protein